MTKPTLHDEFPDYDRAQWRTLAEKGLRGADFGTLESRTEDGVPRGPLFDGLQRPDGTKSLPRTDAPLLDGRHWHIGAPVLDDDPAYANEQLLADLKGGASAVHIMDGTVTRKADLKRLLEGVYVDLVPIIFAPNSVDADIVLQSSELANVSVTLGLDPLGALPDMPESWRAFTIDAASVHEAGGTDAMDLSVFAATAAQGFRTHGSTFHHHISALFTVGTDAHLNIVKIRAARRIYATIAGHQGIDDAALPMHAITSLRMMQSEDAWTNLLRTMSAGFGAVAGGADFVTIRPFTETPAVRRLGDATGFGHRIARNQQLLMMEESHVGQVQDVAYGSYFHERLTEDLAQAAWAKFQEIEGDGGIEHYRRNGLAADLANAITQRSERDEPVLGVTLHPANDVKAPEVR